MINENAFLKMRPVRAGFTVEVARSNHNEIRCNAK